MSWARYVVGLAFVAATVAVVWKGVRTPSVPALEVTFADVRKGTVQRTIAGAGRVQPATKVKISSNLTGDLIELPVKEGDVVTKGQVLARIDRRKFDATMKQAQAAASAAKSDAVSVRVEVDRLTTELARIEGLAKKDLASTAEVDRARSDLDGARARQMAAEERAGQAHARFEDASHDVARTTLLAPIDGTIIDLSREVGEKVRGSDFSEDVVMTLAALASMEVRIEVTEHEVVHLKLGQPADIRVDALDAQTFAGTVKEIAQQASVRNAGTEQETASFPVTIALTARPEGVLPGMAAEVRVMAERRDDAVLIPVQAVAVRPTKSLPDSAAPAEGAVMAAPRKGDAMTKVVFAVDGDSKVKVRRVKLGVSSDTDVEVLEGLSAGERIVEGPFRVLAKELKDGDAVKVADEKAGGAGRGGRPGGKGT